jgi:hypothetical protein
LCWTCRLLLVVKPFLLCWFCKSMRMGDLFIFYNLPWFLFSMVCSFSCKDHLHPLLRLLIPRYLIISRLLLMELFSYILFQSFHWRYIERLLIFPSWFSILLFCKSCLWCLEVFWILLGKRSCHLRVGIIWLLL